MNITEDAKRIAIKEENQDPGYEASSGSWLGADQGNSFYSSQSMGKETSYRTDENTIYVQQSYNHFKSTDLLLLSVCFNVTDAHGNQNGNPLSFGTFAGTTSEHSFQHIDYSTGIRYE